MYYKLSRPWLLTTLLVIETIWGLSFFRDACNYFFILVDYCISGCAVQWYFQKEEFSCCQPLKYLFCKNIGSVISGSFINGFLYIPSLIINTFCDDVDFCLCNLFDMSRGDVYAYIYLTGASYCHACRQCEYLCYRSEICKGHESINDIYALAARLVLALSSVLIIYWIARDNLFESKTPPLLLLGIFFMCLFVTGYFIDIHVDAAEALLICFLAEYEMDQVGYKNMPISRDTIKDRIHEIEE